MVFNRYSSPFLFLDNLILNNKLTSGIETIYKNYNEDKLYNHYLATLPLNDLSYVDWKNEVLVSNSKNVEVDLETTKKQAKEILKNTKPE